MNRAGVLPGDVKLGDDIVGINVLRDASGNLRVQFDERDVVADSVTVYESKVLAMPAGNAQIVLRLEHHASNQGIVNASFDIVAGGTVTQYEFNEVGKIFGVETPGIPGDDEAWTRVQLTAFGPDADLPVRSGTYGSLSVVKNPLTGNAELTYTLDNADPDTNALKQGQSVVDTLALRVTDEYGLSAFRTVSVNIAGANDAPVIGEQGSTGVVYEDGARPAIGTLIASDVDQGHALAWTIDSPAIGSYGTLSLTGSGDSASWTYALANAQGNVQALGQGERVSDSFTVRATDEAGASDTQVVKVDIVGTNDLPILTQPFFGVPPLIEDGAQSSFSAKQTAFDTDHGAVLHWSAGGFTAGSVASAYQSNYRFTVDDLKVTRNGATLFQDSFDPSTPPSAPIGYVLLGQLSESADGRGVLDGARAGAISGVGNSQLMAGNFVVLNTDITGSGTTLKSTDDFAVEARFDLALPGLGHAYGISLSDRNSGGGVPAADARLGDDLVGLDVMRDTAGNLVLQFAERDAVEDTITVYGRKVLAMPVATDASRVISPQIRPCFASIADATWISAE